MKRLLDEPGKKMFRTVFDSGFSLNSAIMEEKDNNDRH